MNIQHLLIHGYLARIKNNYNIMDKRNIYVCICINHLSLVCTCVFSRYISLFVKLHEYLPEPSTSKT